MEEGMSVCVWCVKIAAAGETIRILLLPKSAARPWVSLCPGTSTSVRMG
jgi:hypothetical protein